MFMPKEKPEQSNFDLYRFKVLHLFKGVHVLDMDERHLIFYLLNKAQEDITSILMHINVPLLVLVD